MHLTQPKVTIVARPAVDWEALRKYLASIDADTWLDRVHNGATSQGELLVEFAARSCYRSFEPGLNPNVTQVRTDSAAYLMNILASGHGAVLEHANYTFIFQDVSRVFTHELVRHRAGVAISQESLRYVRLTDLGFRVPRILQKDGMGERIVNLVEQLEDFQRDAAKAFGLDDAGVPFHYKKEVTSALRRLAPLGLSTTIVWTANLRTIRHVLALRTSEAAEEEIRLVFDQVGRKMLRECPLLFADFEQHEVEGTDVRAWTTPYNKV